MNKERSFSEKQKRRFQELLDKTAEAAQRGKKLSAKEEEEMFKLAALATIAYQGFESPHQAKK